MTAAVIAIGNELLSGLSLETNSHYLIRKLKSTGIATSSVSVVGDDSEAIIRALNGLGREVNLVLVTGGLGPTHDDITMQTAADYFGSDIIYSQEAWNRIQKLFADRGISSLKNVNRNQALVPAKAELVSNMNGTAQGFKFTQGNRTYYFMPGVPAEMKKMFDEFIFPELRKQSTRSITTRIIRTTGIPESVLYQKIEDWIGKNNELAISILPRFPEVDISVSQQHNAVMTTTVEQSVRELSKLLGDDIFGFDEDTLESVVARQLLAHRLTIATAESCTGGLIASRLTDIPGSSGYFTQGIITYSNQSKIERLGVSEETLKMHGAVSRETAREMAQNIRKIAGTDIGLSATGIAGPDGGSPEKPLGTVFIGLSTDSKEEVFHFQYNRDRLSNKLFFSQMALNQLRLTLKGSYE